MKVNKAGLLVSQKTTRMNDYSMVDSGENSSCEPEFIMHVWLTLLDVFSILCIDEDTCDFNTYSRKMARYGEVAGR